MTPVLRGVISSSAPIGLWAVHVTALAALSDPVCDQPELRWLPHALTAVLLVLCVPFLVPLVGLARRPADSAGDGQLRFLGLVGLLMWATSVLLIVAEELFAVGIDPCRGSP